MDHAITQAGDYGTGGVFDTIDPSRSARVDISAVMTTLGLSLSFPPGSTSSVEYPNIVNRVTQTVLDNPFLSEVLFPVGAESSYATIADLNINDIKTQFKVNLQQVLSRIQGVNATDTTLFLALTGGGDFNVPYKAVPRVTPTTLPLAFNTYLLTSAWAAKNWSALILPGVDALGLANGTTGCPPWAANTCAFSKNIGCDGGYTAYGECADASWWYSASSVLPLFLLL